MNAVRRNSRCAKRWAEAGGIRMNRERIIILVVAVIAVAAAVWYQLRGEPSPTTTVTASAPPTTVPADTPEPVKPAAHLTAAQDHARILKLLKLTSLRPGVTPATANADEAKANPYPDLPDPLKLDNGKPVLSTDMWWQQRRQEIADTVERMVYGQLSPNVSVVWTAGAPVPGKIGAVDVTTTEVLGRVGGARPAIPPIQANIKMTVWLPATAKGPVPVIMMLKGPDTQNAPVSTWREQVLAMGWGAAAIDVTTIQPDNGADLTQGSIGISTLGQPRGLADWGALRVWAWGASRAIDHLEADGRIDGAHIGIAGHSRYARAALIAMAYDARLVVAYISSSGVGGAAPFRRHFGEQLENLASVNEYHLFAPNFLQYAGKLTAKNMPVDTHDLFALAAPRPIFISAGSVGEDWVDPKGMFMAEVAATPVYKLMGRTGLASTTMPAPGTADDAGELAFRQHAEGHTMEPNWPYFIKFAARYMKPKPKP